MLTLILNITFASIATILASLGLYTLKTIKHLNTGKSFWIPVIMSSLLFVTGSIITISNETGMSLPNANEIALTAQLVAVCFLLGGIYSYSRTIRKNLSEKYIIPKGTSIRESEIEADYSSNEAIPQHNLVKSVSGCNHQLGYLRNLPSDASLPEECLSCDRIIKCKHF